MFKAYYLGAEITEMIEYIDDIVIFSLSNEKYPTAAATSEIVLEVA